MKHTENLHRAFNSVYGGWYVKGKLFTGDTKCAASLLNAAELAVVRATFINVEVVRVTDDHISCDCEECEPDE